MSGAQLPQVLRGPRAERCGVVDDEEARGGAVRSRHDVEVDGQVRDVGGPEHPCDAGLVLERLPEAGERGPRTADARSLEQQLGRRQDTRRRSPAAPARLPRATSWSSGNDWMNPSPSRKRPQRKRGQEQQDAARSGGDGGGPALRSPAACPGRDGPRRPPPAGCPAGRARTSSRPSRDISAGTRVMLTTSPMSTVTASVGPAPLNSGERAMSSAPVPAATVTPATATIGALSAVARRADRGPPPCAELGAHARQEQDAVVGHHAEQQRDDERPQVRRDGDAEQTTGQAGDAQRDRDGDADGQQARRPARRPSGTSRPGSARRPRRVASLDVGAGGRG